jgi:hypothetical protein
MRFEVFTAVNMCIFWVAILCSVVQMFRGTSIFRIEFHPQDGGDTFLRNVGKQIQE